MEDLSAQAMAMARVVKRARGALVDAVCRALDAGEAGVLRAAHTQIFENLDPAGTRLTTLAERAQISHQAMGSLVDELVRHGYLERVPDPADRRARLIRPTTPGRAELSAAAVQLHLIHERWQSELGDLTTTQVTDALGTLIRICQPPAPTDAP
jgi:DNA-binding MarR family transcriptional regulator